MDLVGKCSLSVDASKARLDAMHGDVALEKGAGCFT